MKIELLKATESDIKEIWKMQVEAFKGLLEKYQDYDGGASDAYIEMVKHF